MRRRKGNSLGRDGKTMTSSGNGIAGYSVSHVAREKGAGPASGGEGLIRLPRRRPVIPEQIAAHGLGLDITHTGQAQGAEGIEGDQFQARVRVTGNGENIRKPAQAVKRLRSPREAGRRPRALPRSPTGSGTGDYHRGTGTPPASPARTDPEADPAKTRMPV